MMKKRILSPVILVMILSMTLSASADELTLPGGLTAIEEEAFSGNTSLNEVILPDGIQSIGTKAFSGSGITRIYLPESLTYIAPDAFDQCGPVTGYGPEPTYASDYFDAVEGLSFEHTPRQIALLIGNGDYNRDGDTLDENDLKGPHFDVNVLESVLPGLNPSWEVTKRTDVSASSLLSLINSVFGDSTANDLCLFYYSGHGSAGGYLSCVDNWNTVSPLVLAARLNQAAKGKVIVVLDCCYSGATIAENEAAVTAKGRGTADPLADFNAAVISAFSGYTIQTEPPPAPEGITLRSGELRQDKFSVLTACAKDQTSTELTNANYSYGLMTFYLVDSLGCSYPGGVYSGDFSGDSNGDSKLTLGEAKTYITGSVSAKQQSVLEKRNRYYEKWLADWNNDKTFRGVYYSQYDEYFNERFDYTYHAFDQITSSYGDDNFVLFER